MTITYAETASPRLMSKTQEGELSAFACPRCGFHLPKNDERDFIHYYAHTKNTEIPCQSCGEGFTFDRYLVTVEPSSSHLLDDQTAKTSYWYHATTVENWLETVNNPTDMAYGEIPFVHVGTREAALDRAKLEYFNNGIFYRVVLIKITLSESVQLASSIHKDTNYWPAAVDDESIQEFGGDAIRYINSYEMPGSISLLVDPSKLVMVDQMSLYLDDV